MIVWGGTQAYYNKGKALPLMLRFCWDLVIDKKSYETLVIFKKGTWEKMTTPYIDKGINKIKASLPDRTREAIFAQAGKMGLTELRLWQPVEDGVLRDIYPEGGVPGVREGLPHRTIPAIKHRVKALGLRSFKRKKRISLVRHDGGG
ncbi:DUF2931 family protein [Serratia sp. IR-2025]